MADFLDILLEFEAMAAKTPAQKTTEAPAKTLPRCPACGSYALYREKDGTLRQARGQGEVK